MHKNTVPTVVRRVVVLVPLSSRLFVIARLFNPVLLPPVLSTIFVRVAKPAACASLLRRSLSTKIPFFRNRLRLLRLLVFACCSLRTASAFLRAFAGGGCGSRNPSDCIFSSRSSPFIFCAPPVIFSVSALCTALSSPPSKFRRAGTCRGSSVCTCSRRCCRL